MSGRPDRAQVDRDQSLVVRRRTAEFQEVPREADAVRDAFLQSARAKPGDTASTLANADGATWARAVSRLQEVHGNAFMQRVVAEAQGIPSRLVGHAQSKIDLSQRTPANQSMRLHQAAVSVQRAGWFKRKWESFKERLGLKPDEEAMLEELKSALGRSQQLCSVGAAVTSSPDATKRLSTAAEKLGQAGKALGKSLSIRGTIRDILAFSDAVRALEKADPSKDTVAASKAFGAVFASAGKLGQRLPPGPWTPYFTFLSEAGDFFYNVSHGIIPGWRRRERNMIEGARKEGNEVFW